MPLPLLPWFLAFFSGVLVAQPLTESFFPWFLALASLAWALGPTLVRRPAQPLRLLCLGLMFLLGLANVLWRSESFPVDHIWNFLEPQKKARVEGVIVDLPQRFPDKTRYRVRLEKINYGKEWVPVSGVAWISLYGEGAALHWGERVRFPPVRLRRPLNFRNPGRFDYETFMRSNGIDVTGGTSKWKQVEQIGQVPFGGLPSLILTLRQRMQALLEHNLQPEEQGILRGLVFGDKSGLTPEIFEAYQATGMGHLLAVSGLHIGFVAFVFYWTGNRLLFFLFWKFRPEWAQYGYARKGAALISLLAVVVYMALVGPRVSSLRAGVLVIAFLLAFWINRERELVNTLLLAALLILIWDPRAVYGLGFQLSFLAALAIVLALRWIAEPGPDPLERMGEIPWYRRWATPGVPADDWREKTVDVLVGATFISLVAWAATFPVLLFQIHRVSLSSPFLNPFLVPLASVLIPGCLMILFLGLVFPGLAGLLLVPVGWLATVFVNVPSAVAALPDTSLYLPHPHWFWLVLFYLFLSGWAYRFYLKRNATERRPLSLFWRRLAPWGLAVCGLVLLLGLVFPKGIIDAPGKLHVWILDVGQGESIYVEFPDGRNLLLDGGGYFKDSLDVGTRVVGSFLWNRGVGRIDYLAATHSDQDHIDGVESVLEYFKVGHVLSRPDGPGDRRYARLLSRAMVLRVPLKPFGPGEVLRVGEVRLTNLHPTEAFNNRVRGKGPRGRLVNDRSWVLLLEYRRFRMLLTGDILKPAEEWLVENRVDMRAQVLKAPHHGSRSSSSLEFLRAVGARDVMISSGFANYFHHPHPSVVRRYRENGARVWNTGNDGALHLESDGEGYTVHAFRHLSNWN